MPISSPLLVVLLAAGADLRDPASLAAPPTSVLFDTEPDGTIWALGENYKMRFSSDGAAYFPGFGARAERHHPLRFGLAAPILSPPTRDGARVVVDRGAFTEVYDLAPDSVEQSFVLPRRPNAGGFLLRLAVDTDLAAARTQDGIAFDAGDLGHVTYGDARIVDAAGRALTVRSEWDGGGIRIEVPSGFLAAARYPVVVDPVITTSDVDGGAVEARRPAVAWARVPQTFLVAFERVFTASDHDVVTRRYSKDFAFLDEAATEITAKDTRDVAVASDGVSFLIAWTDRNNAATGDNVRARSRLANNTQQNPIFDVAATAANERTPDVGGTTSYPSFLVVFETDANGNEDVAAREADGVTALGSIVDLTPAQTTTDERTPRVTTYRVQTPAAWFVVWSSGPNTFGTADIEGVLVGAGAAAMTPVESLSGVTKGDDLLPDVSTDGQVDLSSSDPQTCLVAWQETDGGGDQDVLVRAYRIDTAIHALGGVLNLSELALGTTAANSSMQSQPVLGSDGCRFTCVFAEDHDLYCSVAHVDDDVIFFEKHTLLANTGDLEVDPAIARTTKPVPGAHLIAWTADNGAGADVRGALFTSFASGGVTVIQNGCGGALEPQLFPVTNPIAPDIATVAAPGNTFSVGCGSLTSPIVFAGPLVNLPLCPNQGGCVLGAYPLVTIPLPASLTRFGADIPPDPAIVGAAIAIQILDQLPAGAATPKCGPPKYNQEFRTSDTLNVVFQ